MSNPNSVPVPAPPTGRVIEQVEVVVLTGGNQRQRHSVSTTFLDPQGTSRTREVTHSTPLDCGCSGKELHDVTLCSECGAQVCRSRHARQCRQCGGMLCSCCAGDGQEADQAKGPICRECRRKNRVPRPLRLLGGVIYGD